MCEVASKQSPDLKKYIALGPRPAVLKFLDPPCTDDLSHLHKRKIIAKSGIPPLYLFCNKNSATCLRSIYNVLSVLQMFYVLTAMRWSEAFRFVFYRDGKKRYTDYEECSALKLKTFHKCLFFHLYKRQNSMLYASCCILVFVPVLYTTNPVVDWI